MSDYKRYNFSQDFINFLIKTGEGFITSEQLDKTLALLENEAHRNYFTKQSETNLIRIISSLFDRKSFLIELAGYPHRSEIICAIASHSNYLTDIVVRHPEFLHLLFNEEYLQKEIIEESLVNELTETTGRFKSLERKIKFIKIFKRKYLLKIGVADILDYADLRKTTGNLSVLAKVISRILFGVCYNDVCERNEIETDHQRYCLCALGKLGGNELNYSSDIDLIIFYDKNEVVGKLKKEFHEIITEAVQLFVKKATYITEDSYIYRIDFRLRPDGRNAILSRTVADYIKYYETRGEEWERQMMIKLGYVAGSKNLFNRFKSFIDKFVYPSSINEPVSQHIKRMKSSIEDRLKNEQNIKLARGGIRDIEFSVQALQLMNGGKNPEVRTGNSTEAIEKLNKYNLLDKNEKETLINAYEVYRKIEHYLQLMNDKQTHSIPQTGDIAYKLPLYLGFKNYEEFMNELADVKNGVRKIYESILGSEEETEDKYSPVNFANRNKAKKDIQFLEKGISLVGEKQFDSKTINAFNEIEPHLISYLEKSEQPDLVVENFARIIKTSVFPSIWYDTFEDKKFFKSFLTLCEYSQRAVNLLVTDKAMGDFLLTKTVFAGNIEYLIKGCTPKQFLFVLAVQQILGILDTFEFSQTLSNYVLYYIREAVKKKEINYNFFIAGLGSFGNEEMNFSSDIDLIVLIENAEDFSRAQKDFQGILAEIQKKLFYFEIDFRLRPEGKSSPLVWDFNGYVKYFETRLQFWELQALSKMKLAYGDDNLFNKFCTLAEEKLSSYSKDDIVASVLNMYSKKLKAKSQIGSSINLKNSNGTLGTLDTLIQLNLLTNKTSAGKILNTNVKDKFELLYKINAKDAEQIERNYAFLKTLEITIQNIFDQMRPIFPKDDTKKDVLAKKLNYSSSHELENKLNEIINSNIKMLNAWKTE